MLSPGASTISGTRKSSERQNLQTPVETRGAVSSPAYRPQFPCNETFATLSTKIVKKWPTSTGNGLCRKGIYADRRLPIASDTPRALSQSAAPFAARLKVAQGGTVGVHVTGPVPRCRRPGAPGNACHPERRRVQRAFFSAGNAGSPRTRCCSWGARPESKDLVFAFGCLCCWGGG